MWAEDYWKLSALGVERSCLPVYHGILLTYLMSAHIRACSYLNLHSKSIARAKNKSPHKTVEFQSEMKGYRFFWLTCSCIHSVTFSFISGPIACTRHWSFVVRQSVPGQTELCVCHIFTSTICTQAQNVYNALTCHRYPTYVRLQWRTKNGWHKAFVFSKKNFLPFVDTQGTA